MFESSHVPGKKVKSNVSNVFCAIQPCPCSMYSRNQKQKGLETMSHRDKKKQVRVNQRQGGYLR